jgi:hypothetical protein
MRAIAKSDEIDDHRRRFTGIAAMIARRSPE